MILLRRFRGFHRRQQPHALGVSVKSHSVPTTAEPSRASRSTPRLLGHERVAFHCVTRGHDLITGLI